MRGFILLALVVCVGCSGSKPTGEEPVRQTTSDKQRNIDYLKMAELDFEITALVEMGAYWTLEATKNPPLGSIKSRIAIIDTLSKKITAENDRREADLLKMRKSFLEKHGVEMLQWRDHFNKQFPERIIAHEEIGPVVKRQSMTHVDNTISHLFNLPADQFNDGLRLYLSKQAYPMINEVISKVKNIESMAILKRRVNGHY